MTDMHTKEAVLELGKAYVESIMRERGEIGLMIFGHGEDNSLMAFPLDHLWGDSPLLRDIAIAAVKSKLKAAGAKTYLAVSEAWMVSHQMKDDEDVNAARLTVGSPSQHPDRIEVVSLIAGDATGTIGAVFLIKRKDNGRFDHLEAYAVIDRQPAMTDGRFADLLLDRGRAN